MPGGLEGRAILSVVLFVAAIAVDLPRVLARIHDDRRIHRNLLGAQTSFSKETLTEMGVPEGARLLVQSKSNCSYPLPAQFKPKAALICGVARATRKCLGLHKRTPGFIAQKCMGQQCVLDLAPPEPDCVLRSRGIERNLTDPELEPYCGIQFQDHKDWLEPNFENLGCWSAMPVGVKSDFRVACEDGVLGNVQLHVNFSKPHWDMPVDTPYACRISILCQNDAPGGLLVCYQQEKEMMKKEMLKEILKRNDSSVKKAANDTGGVPLHILHAGEKNCAGTVLSLTWIVFFVMGGFLCSSW
ncbi:hypothetical protein BSKO_12757 [Bryopsis sp. KO-2023]|nr:hypothetical protein BSKO_12757 [Bryopsis sp. KO-2023]